MDEDTIKKFVDEQKFIKAEIGDEIGNIEIDNDENEDLQLEEGLYETFVPNIKEDNKNQNDAITEFLSKNYRRGELVKDVEWQPGFFLKT